MKKIIVLHTTIFILFCGIALSFGQTVSEEAKRHFDRGMAASSTGNWVFCPYKEIEIEVVPKTHVRVRQKIVKLYVIDTPFIEKTYFCEYRKISVRKV